MNNKFILGTVQFGLDYGINNIIGKPSREQVFMMLEYAAQHGVKSLDTADAYGTATKLLGDFNSDHPGLFSINTKFKGNQVPLPGQLTNSLNFEGIYCNLSVMDQADYVDLITSIKWRRASFPGGKKVYGLVFVDPNGCPPWDECEKLGACKQYDRLDLLIHVNATAHKRLFHHSWMGENMRLEERLRRIGKKHIFLWVPEGGNQWQFSLAFCTNWKEFPEFKRKGFYSIDSTEGRELLDRLQYTREDHAA